jgi:hypothetical protein
MAKLKLVHVLAFLEKRKRRRKINDDIDFRLEKS